MPDVVGNAEETINLFPKYSQRIRNVGYKVAFVAQDGQENLPFPDEIDALFIGGSTKWKLGIGAEKCIKRAKEKGLWVHVGRVNTKKRMKHFSLLNVNSVDGTHITYGPDKKRKELIRWMEETRLPLFFI